MSAESRSVNTFPARTWARLSDGYEVVGHVPLTFRVWYSDGFWQAKCAELEVPSFGDDPGSALDAVIEATIGYLNELEEQNERERVFAERGLTLRAGGSTRSPDDETQTTVKGRDEGALLMELGLAAASGE